MSTESYSNVYSFLFVTDTYYINFYFYLKERAGEEIVIKHPEFFVAADETGDNTNMSDDNKRSGGKVVGAIDSNLNANISTFDCHFTVVPFLGSHGKPLLCCVIIASGTPMAADWACGLDLFQIYSKELRPYGPCCVVNGLEIPTLVCVSEKGGILDDILVRCLCQIDASGVYGRERAVAACKVMGWDVATTIRPDRNRPPGSPAVFVPATSDGKTPTFLADGHGSRFSIEFLRHVALHGPTPWLVVLGVPYKTDLWQCGDDSAANGLFKYELHRVKMILNRDKELSNLAHNQKCILQTDIIPLVNVAWNRSFNNEENMKKVFARKGFNPFTRALLLHPEVLATKPETDTASSSTSSTTSSSTSTETSSSSTSTSTSSSSTSTSSKAPLLSLLNMTTAASHLNKISRLQELQDLAAKSGIRREGVTPGTIDVRPLVDIGRISSGKVCKEGGVEIISDGTILHELVLRDTLKEAEADRIAKDKKTLALKKKTDYDSLITTKLDQSKWGKGNLVTALTYKMGTSSGLKDKNKVELMAIWGTWKDKDPVLSASGDDDEEVVRSEQEAENRNKLLFKLNAMTTEQLNSLLRL